MDVNFNRAVLIALVSVLGTFIVLLQHHIDTYCEPIGVRAFPEDSERGARWYTECMRDDQQLYDESRLRREAFDDLLETLVQRGWLRETYGVPPGEKLLAFLYMCGHRASYRNLR